MGEMEVHLIALGATTINIKGLKIIMGVIKISMVKSVKI